MQEIFTSYLAICLMTLAIPECSQNHFSFQCSSPAPPHRHKASYRCCWVSSLLPLRLSLQGQSSVEPVAQAAAPTVGDRCRLSWCSCRWISSLCRGRWVCTWASSPASCKGHSAPLWGLHCLQRKEHKATETI